ncbi:stalk domain-containing protein [Paenibacillus alkalitolerans]|uniref:stalk domain-containing protein n=1 Tax=Paenibacillus alkalitolerans TaxID=2799335 RepID=UPI0018F2BCA5|nr:stalk domain-containing protein [Paenibacillus alkalitolerans]
MRKLLTMLLSGILFVCGAPPTYADEESKKTLSEVFDRMVIIPYDFQGKAFVNGQKSEVYQQFEAVERNGRVLVPIRFMGYLATQAGNYSSSWDVHWDQKHPDDILLTNYALQKTVKFTVNSKTMLVNKQPVALDVPPQ